MYFASILGKKPKMNEFSDPFEEFGGFFKDLGEKEPTAAKREMWECLDLSNSWWSLRL